MAGSIRRRASACGLWPAVLLRLAAKRALINLAIGQARERQAVVFQFVHHFRRVATHEFDGVLVAQIIGAFHGVVHMPVPVIRRDVAECGSDAALRGNSVGASGEHFRHDCHLEI